jgi:hypothetical protein
MSGFQSKAMNQVSKLRFYRREYSWSVFLALWFVSSSALAFAQPEPQAIRSRSVDPADFLGPDGEPLPFDSFAEVLEFLKTAAVIKSEDIGEGVTGARRVLLEKDGKKMRAVFRDVSIFRHQAKFPSGAIVLNFRDDAIFECAAFELSRLLDLRLVPPTVQRSVGGKKGTLQVWMEAATMEKERVQKRMAPPDTLYWVRQHQLMYLFDNLISNNDRHSGNILFMPNWRMILIDHTRAFQLTEKLLWPERIRACERGVFEKLKALDAETLKSRLGPYLSGTQISAILRRRDGLVEHIEGLIEKRGEESVLFDFWD